MLPRLTSIGISGLGDSLRGRFMDFVDSSQGVEHPETQKGREEVERGMARLKGQGTEQPPQGSRAPIGGGSGPQGLEGQRNWGGESQGPTADARSNGATKPPPPPPRPANYGPGADLPSSEGYGYGVGTEKTDPEGYGGQGAYGGVPVGGDSGMRDFQQTQFGGNQSTGGSAVGRTAGVADDPASRQPTFP